MWSPDFFLYTYIIRFKLTEFVFLREKVVFFLKFSKMGPLVELEKQSAPSTQQYSPMNEKLVGGCQRAPTDAEL